MKLLTLTFLSVFLFQQESPYAEFYTSGGKIDFEQPLKASSSLSIDVKIKRGEQELNCSIRRGTVSLIRGSSSLQSEVITSGNNFNLSTLINQAKPGDKILFNLADVWNVDRNQPVSLSETIFSVVLN